MNYFHMHAQMQLFNITEVGLFVSAEAAYPTHIQIIVFLLHWLDALPE